MLNRHSEIQSFRKERLTYLDPAILRTIDPRDLMPIEVDDEMIFKHMVLPQSSSETSLASGFNISSRMFWVSIKSFEKEPETLPMVQGSCSCMRFDQPLLQLAHFQSRLLEIKYILDNVPPQFRQWRRTDTEDTVIVPNTEQEQLIKAQFESIRANIHVTHLWIQSILLEQIDDFQRVIFSHQPLDSSISQIQLQWNEKEDTCRQLLHILHSVADVHLESNGHHLVSLKASHHATILIQSHRLARYVRLLQLCYRVPLMHKTTSPNGLRSI
jgi:hypothetical protein